MKALFVGRHNNDYDSMAPVADAFARLSPENEVVYYFASPELTWRRDFRTRLLEGNGRTHLTDLWEVAAPGPLARPVRRFWERGLSARRVSKKLAAIATEFLVASRFETRMRAMLDKERPQIIAFDRYFPPARRERYGYFGYQEMLGWARERKVPVVALPHGLALYDMSEGGDRLAGTPFAVHFCESERERKRLVARGADPGTVEALGSARYDPAWVETLLGALGLAQAAPPGDGRVAVTFFATKRVYDFDFDLLLDWLGHLGDHPKVDLTIQPHPRGQREAVFHGVQRGRPNVRIDRATPASALIARSHLVSTLVSSVVVEAAVRDREILYPAYVNTVSTRFAEAGACIALESREATHAAIDAWLAGRRTPRRNYQAFLRESVHGGAGSDSALRYARRLAELAQPIASGRPPAIDAQSTGK